MAGTEQVLGLIYILGANGMSRTGLRGLHMLCMVAVYKEHMLGPGSIFCGVYTSLKGR